MENHNLKNSAIAKPFLKWAGSKRLLLKYLVDLIPIQYGTYYEPFLGSGSLFFYAQPRKAVLSDKSEELIKTFLAVKNNVNALIYYLKSFKVNKREYYSIRKNRSYGSIKRGAEFIYLNKTCWNGLYRVNLSGDFNVPYGLHPKQNLFNHDNLILCSKILSGSQIKIKVSDFESIISSTKKGDFVYLDPPYVTGHNNNGFIEYNEDIFSWDDQERLSRLATKLAQRGVKVLISNANHSDILKLYPSFHKKTIQRHSTIASNPSKRRIVSEVILFSNL